MDAELEMWKVQLQDSSREALLVLAVAVLEVLDEKHGTRITLS